MSQLPRSIEEQMKHLRQKDMSFPDKAAATIGTRAEMFSDPKGPMSQTPLLKIVAPHSRLWDSSHVERIIDPLEPSWR